MVEADDKVVDKGRSQVGGSDAGKQQGCGSEGFGLESEVEAAPVSEDLARDVATRMRGGVFDSTAVTFSNL